MDSPVVKVYKKSAYLYGITDTKAQVENWIIDKPKDDSIKYIYSEHPELTGRRKISKYEKKWRYRETPDTLAELAGLVVDNTLQLPRALKWTCIDVVGWIDDIGLPQYRNTFYRNHINGHSLIFVDACALSAMKINDFSHIKTITKSINELYGMEVIHLIRSISLPPRYPLTHSSAYHAKTGPKYDFTKPSQLFRKMKISRPAPNYDEHWQILEKCLKHKRPTDVEKIGYTTRRNLYKAKKEPVIINSKYKPKQLKIAIDKPKIEDIFSIILTENEIRKGWILNYLCEHKSLLVNFEKYCANEIDFTDCTCDICCKCQWDPIEFEPIPRTMEILRKQLYKKYEVVQSQYTQPLHRASVQSRRFYN